MRIRGDDMSTPKKFTGKQKAAITLISLGPNIAAQVFKHLSDEEIEQLTLEIASIRKVSSEERESILDEFHQICLAQEYITHGGIEYAKDILEKALGTQKALDVINRLTASLQVKPFDFIRKAEASQILNFIQNEHPQTIALILAYLHPDQAALILSSLPQEKQVDVAKRIAIMDRTSPEILREVENVLEKKMANLVTQDYTRAGGVESVVDILNTVDRGTEKTILDTLEVQDPELAEEIKKRMFIFEDIVNLDSRSIQKVIKEIDNKDLALALKGSSEDVAKIIYKNMSQRMSDMLKEEIQYLGPVRLREVEESQQKIVSIIRKLEESGDIIISRGGGDEIIV